jgi:ribosomal subunit interface protein
MQIMFSSKTVELTDKVKGFLLEKLDRLKKFPSLGLEQIQIVVDRVKRHGKTTSEAEVEVVAQMRGHRFAFKEVGENLYQAFYKVYEKMERRLSREKFERKKR